MPFDDKGYHTETRSSRRRTELIIASVASLIIFGLLWKFAGPSIKKASPTAPPASRTSSTTRPAAKVAAEAEAAEIRQAKGDIEAERARLLAEADAQAEALLADGRARLEAELAELEAQADADIAGRRGALGDELRAEIARHLGRRRSSASSPRRSTTRPTRR